MKNVVSSFLGMRQLEDRPLSQTDTCPISKETQQLQVVEEETESIESKIAVLKSRLQEFSAKVNEAEQKSLATIQDYEDSSNARIAEIRENANARILEIENRISLTEANLKTIQEAEIAAKMAQEENQRKYEKDASE